jgi:hypothetical protein
MPGPLFHISRLPHKPCHAERRGVCAAKDLSVTLLHASKLIHLSRLPRGSELLHQLLLPFQQFPQPCPARIRFNRFLHLR